MKQAIKGFRKHLAFGLKKPENWDELWPCERRGWWMDRLLPVFQRVALVLSLIALAFSLYSLWLTTTQTP